MKPRAEIEEENKAYRERSEVFKKLADNEREKSLKDTAIQDYNTAINTRRSIDVESCTAEDWIFLSDCYENLGLIYSELNRNEEIRQYRLALTALEKIQTNKRNEDYYAKGVNISTNLIEALVQNCQGSDALAHFSKIIKEITPQTELKNYNKLLVSLADTVPVVVRTILQGHDADKAKSFLDELAGIQKCLINPGAATHRQFSTLWSTIGAHYGSKGHLQPAIDAYHTSIAELSNVTDTEMSDADRREFSKLYMNLALKYKDYNIPAQIEALEHAIAWNNKIIEWTHEDKRSLALMYFRLGKANDYQPDTIAAGQKVLNQQPCEFKDKEYFEEHAEWCANVAAHIAARQAKKDAMDVVPRVDTLEMQVEELSQRLGKRKAAYMLAGHPNAMFPKPTGGEGRPSKQMREQASEQPPVPGRGPMN